MNIPYRRAGVEDQVGYRVTQVVQVHSCQKETDSLPGLEARGDLLGLSKCKIVFVFN